MGRGTEGLASRRKLSSPLSLSFLFLLVVIPRLSGHHPSACLPYSPLLQNTHTHNLFVIHWPHPCCLFSSSSSNFNSIFLLSLFARVFSPPLSCFFFSFPSGPKTFISQVVILVSEFNALFLVMMQLFCSSLIQTLFPPLDSFCRHQ